MQEKLDPPHPVSWLKKTGQLWKLYGILGLGVPAIVLQVLVWFASDAPRRDYQSLLLLTLVAYVLCVWFPWITLAIRCPDCKRRIGWFAISTLPANQWLTGMITATTCLACGANGTKSEE